MPSVFLVEHYWPGVTQASFADATERVAAAVRRLADSGAEIRFMHSTLVPEDEAAFCVLSADSEQQVVDAYGAAGIRFERILPAVESAMSGRSLPIPVDGETASPTHSHDGGPTPR